MLSRRCTKGAGREERDWRAHDLVQDRLQQQVSSESGDGTELCMGRRAHEGQGEHEHPPGMGGGGGWLSAARAEWQRVRVQGGDSSTLARAHARTPPPHALTLSYTHATGRAHDLQALRKCLWCCKCETNLMTCALRIS